MRADSLAWDDIAKFRDIWPGVLMLKGVNRPDDAIKALGYGVDGIVVSNHGGRNMDSAAATLDVLPEIAEAVGDKMTLILDSGVRRGSDIVKALALGAKAVLTGRATLYGTAVGGEAGALKAINILKNEADKTMAYTGCRTLDEVSSDIFWGYREGNRLVGRLNNRQPRAQHHCTGRQRRDRDPDRGARQPWCLRPAWDVGFLASAHHRQSSPGAYGIGTIHGGKAWLTPSIR